MVVLHITLIVLAFIFGIFAFLALICAWDGSCFIGFIIAALLCGLCIWGANAINEANTITETEVVKIEIKEMTYNSVQKGYEDCHILGGNDNQNFNIEVSLDQYLQHQVGETVDVEVTTKTNKLYGNIKQTVALSNNS
jgi:predicted membrane metal-binding protein